MAKVNDVVRQLRSDGDEMPEFHIVALLRAHPESEQVQRYGFEAITTSERLVEFCSNDGATVLAAAMNNHMDSTDVLLSALSALLHYQVDVGVAWALVNAGCVHKVLECMKRHSTNVDLLCRVCSVLNRMCRHFRELHRLLVQHRAVELMADMVKAHKDTAVLSEHACCLLATLAFHVENRQDFRQQRGVHTFTLAMKNHPDSRDVQVEACRAFCYAVCCSSEGRRALMRCGGISLVTTAMTTHLDDPELNDYACGTLMQLASLGGFPNTVAQQPHLQVLLASLKYHLSIDLVQQKGCAALANIVAAVDEDGRRELASQGVIQAMVEAMKVHTDDTEVQSPCCHALMQLAKHAPSCRRIGELGAVQAIVASMRELVHDIDMANQALLTVMTLAADDLENRRALSSEAGIRAIVSVMRTHEEANDLQSMCVSLLGHLAQDASSAQIITANGGAKALVGAIHAFGGSQDVQANGAISLTKLILHPSSVGAVKACGGVQALVQAMQAHKTHKPLQRAGIRCLASVIRVAADVTESVAACVLDTLNHFLPKEYTLARLSEEDASRRQEGVRHACSLLVKVPFIDVGRRVLLQGDRFSQILVALSTYEHEEDVVQPACEALRNLAQVDAARPAIVSHGGVSIVVSAMRLHSQNASVQERVLDLLQYLVECQSGYLVVRSTNAMRDVVHALVVHRPNFHVCLAACATMRNMVRHNDENKVIVGSSRGVHAALDAARAHHDRPLIMQQVMGLLEHMATVASVPGLVPVSDMRAVARHHLSSAVPSLSSRQMATNVLRILSSSANTP